jgi:hypothetical protein
MADKIEIKSKDLLQYKDIVLECHDDSMDKKTGKPKNTHKFYIFHLTEGASQFDIEYGRIDKSPNKLQYPMSLLQKKFDEKIGKNYSVTRVTRIDEKSIFFADFVSDIFEDGDEWILPE